MTKHQTVRTQLRETRHLVLDDRLIDEVIAAKLTLGEISKHPRNPLFGEDKPWEPRFDNVYANVIYDTEDRLYKCWYNPFIIDKRVTHTPPEKTASGLVQLHGCKAIGSGDGGLLCFLGRRSSLEET